MKNDRQRIFICSGFNNNFDLPEVDSGNRARYRTAIVVKKKSFFDEWEPYDELVWRIIQRIDEDLSATMQINRPERGVADSLSQWRQWQTDEAMNDPEYALDMPMDIRFQKNGQTICRMMFEDWSDTGHPEPYAISYTFSFYCLDEQTDIAVRNAIRKLLSTESAIDEIHECKESASPKWYWPLLGMFNNLRSSIYCLLVAIVLICIYIIIRYHP